MESSSESSGDEEEPEHSDDEAAAGRALGDWHGRVDMEKLPANAEFFRNTQSRVIHLAAISDRLHYNLRVARLSAGCSKTGSRHLLNEWRSALLSMLT